MSTSIARINTPIILEILKKHSSLEHPMTNADILKRARQELIQIGIMEDPKYVDGPEKDSAPVKLSTSTIQRILDDLAELCYDYDSFVRLLGGHVRIMLSRSIPGESDFILYDPDQDKAEKFLSGKTRYYCFEPLMTTEEINILATSVAANPFLSLQQNQTLNQKVHDLFPMQLAPSGSGSSKSNHIPRTVEKDKEHVKNAKLLANITFLLSRIRSNVRVQINHGKYTLMGHNLVSRNQDPFTEVEPITITWSNGFAYLLALIPGDYEQDELSSQIYHYRIDRMIEIQDVVDEQGNPIPCTCLQKLGNNLDILEYQKQHPVMYGGKRQRITFLAKDAKDVPLANLLVDTFGLEYLVQKARPEDEIYLGSLLAEEPDSWYRISVNASAAGTELWAMQHADRVRIVAPDSIVKNMQKRFQDAMRLNQPLP